MYHRIAESDVDPWQLSVQPQLFEQQLQIIKKNWNVISLEELQYGIAAGKVKNRSIVITFDDGYLDNYTTAKPLLEKYALPATFFITTKNIGSKRVFWWDDLQNLVFTIDLPPKLVLNFDDRSFSFDLADEGKLTPALKLKNQQFSAYNGFTTLRSKLYYKLWELLQSHNEMERENLMQKLREWANYNGSKDSGYLSMSEEHICDMASNKLFTLGGHTTNHPSLPFYDKDSQLEEIVNNKNFLERITNRSVFYFAYPSGLYNDVTVECVKAAGFRLAVTTNHSPVFKGTNPYQLGRFQVDNLNQKLFTDKLKLWFKS